MCVYGLVRLFSVTGIVLVITCLFVLDARAQAECGSYVKEDDDCTGSSKDANVSINPGGSFDMKVDTFTKSCTSCTASSQLRVFDNLPFNSDSWTGGGDAEAHKIQKWVWDGPAGTAPGATYSILYNGDGDVSASGTAVAGWCANGSSASSSSNASSSGSGSATGASAASASVNDVGGSANHNGTGSLSGSKTPTDNGNGISASISGGSTGTGTYTRTGNWDINLQEDGDMSGATITVLTKAKCQTSTGGTANGCVAGYAEGYAEAESDASMNATLSNLTEK